ncbi:MAG: MATE family efflux transporter, partial [Bacteroidales bacterium]
VAIGTVLAQYAGLGLNIWVLHWKYKTLLPLFNIHLWLKKSAMKRFLNINRDIFFRTLLIIAVFSSFTAESTKQGPVILVLNTLLYQFFIFYSYAMDGFAHAAEALNGRFTGSGEGIQKIRSVKSIFQWGIVLSFAFVLAYLFGFNTILSLFTTDSQIISLAQPYLFWILGITILGFPAFLWDGVYAGSLATKPMLYIMLISTIAFFALYYSLLPYWGNHALWFALISFLLLRGLTMSIFAKRYIFIK